MAWQRDDEVVMSIMPGIIYKGSSPDRPTACEKDVLGGGIIVL